MINLLPPEVKENILYARRNTRLIQWSVAMIIGIFGCLVVVAFGQLYLSQQVSSYSQQLDDGKARLKEQKLDETQQRVSEISGNLKLVVEVLSRQIMFSKLLRQIGTAIPQGAVLTELTINEVEGGIDLTFEARDYQTATQIQVNLQDPQNEIFNKADIEGVSCQPATPEESTYPCEISIRALFGDNSPYMFIKTPQAAGAKP